MDLDVYDLSYETTDGRLVAKTLESVGGEKQVNRYPAPFKPYCYIEAEDFEKSTVSVFDVTPKPGPDGFMRIEADHPSEIREFEESTVFDTYEADVGFSKRMMINTDIDVAVPEYDEILYFDIEVDDRGAFTEPEDADGRVLSIAAVGGDGEEYYFDDGPEKQLFKKFLTAADDYMVLVGWNSIGYDFPYLENRAPLIGLDPNWERWTKLDLKPLYDMLGRPTETLSLKLDDTAERELGEGKTEGISPGGGELWDAWESGDPMLREYNIQDCEVLRQIDEKYGLIRVLHTICRICNYPPEDSCYLSRYDKVKFAIGQVVDAKILETANRRGIPQRNQRSRDKPDDFPGGYVLDPVPGFYDSLVVPDYSGMYPNIIRAFNFGEETWYESKQALRQDLGDDVSIIDAESGVFVRPDDGHRSVPAETADELIDLREGASEILDKGVKAVNNTLYGVFASDFHRYFGPHSENITLVGQELTGVVEDIANRGHEYIEQVVYGDTDSVMLEMDADDPIDAAHVIASDIEEEMQEWASARNADARYLTLDVDDVYDAFYIGDKKKRYFGHRVFKDGTEADDVKVRGFEYRQNDYPDPVRDFQRELMDTVLFDEQVKPIINEYRDALYAGEFDDQMATEKGLGKPPSEYKADTPPIHARAAMAIREEFGQGVAQVGSKVGYIKFGGAVQDWTWAHEGELGQPLNTRHYEYLWQEKFVSVMESIGVSEHQQTGLGDFV